MKKKIIPIIVIVFVIVGCLCSSTLSVIAIPYMPVKSYAGKMFVFGIVFCFLFFVLLLQLLPFICKKLFINCHHIERKTVLSLCFLLVIVLFCLSLIRLIAPQHLSYLYYFIRRNTQQSIIENDNTCGAIEETVEYDKNNIVYLLEAGNTYYEVENYNKSIVFYRDAWELDKDDANSNYLLGRAYLCGHPGDDWDDGEFEFDEYSLFNAERYLLAALYSNPKNPEYNFELGMTYYYLYTKQNSNDSYYDKAKDCFSTAIDNSPSNEKYRYWFGRLIFNKEPGETKGIFDELVDQNIYVAPFQFWLGRYYLTTGDNVKAASCFDKAKGLDANNSDYQLYADSTRNLIAENSWGDSDNGRPGYSIDEVNKERILKGQITFNSIRDSEYGDEKRFVTAKSASKGDKLWENEHINVEDGGIYTIRLYVNNDNPDGYDAIAEDVTATFSLPTTVGKTHTIIGYIDCINAEPERYWDCVTLYSDEPFYIEYIDGTAKFINDIHQVSLPNEIIISGGTKLGYELMDGEIPGGSKYSGFVTIDVRVHKSVLSELSLKVKHSDANIWEEAINAKIGDEIVFQIRYRNLSSEIVNNVMIRDVLPTNIEYVEDSTVLYNSDYPEGISISTDTITTTGINIGSYKSLENAYIRFTGRVIDKTIAEGQNQLVNWASATVRIFGDSAYVYKDDVSVMVRK